MSSFFEKLMLARQISFKEGRIEYLGNSRLMLLSQGFLGMYTESIADRKEDIIRIYKDCKKDMRDGFIKKITKSHGPTSRKSMVELLKNTAEFGGWGRLDFKKFDETERSAVIMIEDSVVGSFLKGKAKSPCDHVFRGIAAGGASLMFGTDIDCVEVSCVALGDPVCVFHAGSASSLMKDFPEICKMQI